MTSAWPDGRETRSRWAALQPSDGGYAAVGISDSWRLQDEFTALTDVEQPLDDAPRVQRMTFDTTGLTAWDSGLVTFLLELMEGRQIAVDGVAHRHLDLFSGGGYPGPSSVPPCTA